MEWSELGDYKLPCDHGNLKLYIPIFKGLMPTPLRWITEVCVCVCVCVLQEKKVKVKVAQSCLIVCDPTDCIICRILRARILELGTKRFIVSFQLQKVSLREMCNLSQWVASPFSWGSSQLRDQTQVSRIAGAFFSSWATGKPKNTGVGSLSLLLWTSPTQELN